LSFIPLISLVASVPVSSSTSSSSIPKCHIVSPAGRNINRCEGPERTHHAKRSYDETDAAVIITSANGTTVEKNLVKEEAQIEEGEETRSDNPPYEKVNNNKAESQEKTSSADMGIVTSELSTLALLDTSKIPTSCKESSIASSKETSALSSEKKEVPTLSTSFLSRISGFFQRKKSDNTRTSLITASDETYTTFVEESSNTKNENHCSV
jgi:hypothetical protein